MPERNRRDPARVEHRLAQVKRPMPATGIGMLAGVSSRIGDRAQQAGGEGCSRRQPDTVVRLRSAAGYMRSVTRSLLRQGANDGGASAAAAPQLWFGCADNVKSSV